MFCQPRPLRLRQGLPDQDCVAEVPVTTLYSEILPGTLLEFILWTMGHVDKTELPLQGDKGAWESNQCQGMPWERWRSGES
jgi:hypothetical protein